MSKVVTGFDFGVTDVSKEEMRKLVALARQGLRDTQATQVLTSLAPGLGVALAAAALEASLPYCVVLPHAKWGERYSDEAKKQYDYFLPRATTSQDLGLPEGQGMASLDALTKYLLASSDSALFLWDGNSEGLAKRAYHEAFRRGLECVSLWKSYLAARQVASSSTTKSPEPREGTTTMSATKIVETIGGFTGEYRFLSNFWSCTVKWDQDYRSVEHAYCAAKFAENEARDLIQRCDTPGQAKALARKLLGVVDRGRPLHPAWPLCSTPEDLEARKQDEAAMPPRPWTNEAWPLWNRKKLKVMKHLLLQKFAPGSELARKLLATGERKLVETNTWNDTYWGVCSGKGENQLGKLLMDIRKELQKK